jgi:hypothetical protein
VKTIIVRFTIGFAVLGWMLSTGMYLVTMTTYPYERVVGGGALLFAVLGGLVGLVVASEL